MPKVLITDKINKAAGDILASVAQVDFIETLSEDDLAVKIADYDALMIRSQTKVTAKILQAAKNLKIVGRAGVGVDNVDIDEATKAGVIVVNSPDGNTTAAAEHTVALMLSMARHIPAAATSTKDGKWVRSHGCTCNQPRSPPADARPARTSHRPGYRCRIPGAHCRLRRSAAAGPSRPHLAGRPHRGRSWVRSFCQQQSWFQDRSRRPS